HHRAATAYCHAHALGLGTVRSGTSAKRCGSRCPAILQRRQLSGATASPHRHHCSAGCLRSFSELFSLSLCRGVDCPCVKIQVCARSKSLATTNKSSRPNRCDSFHWSPLRNIRTIFTLKNTPLVVSRRRISHLINPNRRTCAGSDFIGPPPLVR